MEDCIFCKIIKGELPSFKVYEDELFLAFLNRYPNVKGHALVIPKKHYQWTYEVPEFEKYWGVALKVTNAIQKSLHPDWLNYFTYGAIPHAHIHILPRWGGISGNQNAVLPPEIKVTEEELKMIAEKINSAF